MTNALTSEQIAQGWRLHDGSATLPIIAGTLVQYEDEEFGVNHIGVAIYIPDMGDNWTVVKSYRTFSPSLPSPPVSGEAVKPQCDQVYEVNADTWYTAATLDKLLHNARKFIINQGLFDAYVTWMQANDPLTKMVEPVGVTISREDAIYLRDLIDFDSAQAEAVFDRLSATIGGRK